MASRRDVGLSAFQNRSNARTAYASHGSSIRTAHGESLQTQLSVFQQLLHQFSITHGKEIRSNPTFRAEFARMCNAIGVDPLAGSSRRSYAAAMNPPPSHHNGNGRDDDDDDDGYDDEDPFYIDAEGTQNGRAVRQSTSTSSKKAVFGKFGSVWTQLLGGGMSDFYFELGVRVVEVCRDSRDENGGLISVNEVRRRIRRGKAIGGGMEVSEDDILRAVRTLSPLGSGFTVTTLGSKQMIRSVPKELSSDQSSVLEVMQLIGGFATVSMLQLNLGWERARAYAILQDLTVDGLAWIDRQVAEPEYWSAAFIGESADSVVARTR